jgi:hypothetical protein
MIGVSLAGTPLIQLAITIAIARLADCGVTSGANASSRSCGDRSNASDHSGSLALRAQSCPQARRTISAIAAPAIDGGSNPLTSLPTECAAGTRRATERSQGCATYGCGPALTLRGLIPGATTVASDIAPKRHHCGAWICAFGCPSHNAAREG